MEPREQDVLQRYYDRLLERLDPKDLLKRLDTLGAIQSEEVLAVVDEWTTNGREERQKQAEWLLENLRNHDQGMKLLVKGLLTSEIQDFLAREMLEDEIFEENDIDTMLESLKDHLSDVQILKLELLSERKKHENTKRLLDEVKSNRTSAIFSDYDSSCCSGFDSSEVSFLLKELDDERKRREIAERRTDEVIQTHQQILRNFKSLEDVSCSRSVIDNLPWKAASVADLCLPERDLQHTEMNQSNKWPSIDSGAQMKDSSSNRNSFVDDDQTTGVIALAEKVSVLQTQLEDEINRREEAEFEIMKLECENRTLHDELFETRDQLALGASQLDIQQDYDVHKDIWDDNEEEYMKPLTTVNDEVYDNFSLGRTASCPSLDEGQYSVELRRSTKRSKRPVSYHGEVSYLWQNRNIEHYEMDQYDEEISTKVDPTDNDFRFALRRLKQDTRRLYNELVLNGIKIKSTKNRAKRINHHY